MKEEPHDGVLGVRGDEAREEREERLLGSCGRGRMRASSPGEGFSRMRRKKEEGEDWAGLGARQCEPGSKSNNKTCYAFTTHSNSDHQICNVPCSMHNAHPPPLPIITVYTRFDRPSKFTISFNELLHELAMHIKNLCRVYRPLSTRQSTAFFLKFQLRY